MHGLMLMRSGRNTAAIQWHSHGCVLGAPQSQSKERRAKKELSVLVASPVRVCTETLQHRDMGVLQGMPGGTRPARRPSHMLNGKRWGAACRPAPLVIYTGDRAQCASPGCSACRAAQRVGDTLETCLTQAHRKRSTANSQNSEQCRPAGPDPPPPGTPRRLQPCTSGHSCRPHLAAAQAGACIRKHPSILTGGAPRPARQ